MYAYKDKYGITHVVEQKYVAEGAAVGEVKDINIPSEYGYPCIEVEGKLISVFDYSDGKIFVGGNEKSGKPLNQTSSEVQEKVKELLEIIGL